MTDFSEFQFLFYKQTQSDVYHTYFQTDRMDVSRFISGEPYWILNEKESLKHKNLIFSDWSRNRYGTHHLFLRKLLREFSIYYKQSDQILKGDEHNLAFIQSCDVFQHPEDLIQQAIEQTGIPQNQWLVLDDYVIDQLTKRIKQNAPRNIPLFRLMFATNDECRRFIASASPAVAEISDNYWSMQEPSQLAQFKQAYPSIIIKKDNIAIVQIIDLHTETLRALAAERDRLKNVLFLLYKHHPECDFKRLLFVFKLIPHLQAMRLQNITCSINIFRTPIFTQINALELHDCSILNFELPSNMQFNNLKSISIKHGTISQRFLKTLLHSSPNIQRITLYECFKMSVDFTIEDTFPKLESIRAPWHDFSLQTLHSILKAAPNLSDECKLQINNEIQRQSSTEFNALPAPVQQFPFETNSYLYIANNAFQQSELRSYNGANPVEMNENALNQHSIDHEAIEKQPILLEENISPQPILPEPMEISQDTPAQELIPSEENKDQNNLNQHSAKTETVTEQPLRPLQKDTDGKDTSPKPMDVHQDILNQQSTSAATITLINKEQDNDAQKTINDLMDIDQDVPVTNTDANHIYQQRVPHIVSQDPPHTSTSYQDYKPSQDIRPFQYLKTKNQTMLIDRLSRYLQITKENLDIVPKIQQGICYALSAGFLASYSSQGNGPWDAMIACIQEWDGQKAVSPMLATHFKTIQKWIRNCQLGNQNIDTTYLGDDLDTFFTKRMSYILHNPWHAITVCPSKENQTDWVVYDPNYVEGHKTVPASLLPDVLRFSLGRLISAQVDKRSLNNFKPVITDPSTFLEEGGLLVLYKNYSQQHHFDLMSTLRDLTYSTSALTGLFIRNLNGWPAWALILKNEKPQHIKRFVINQLAEYILIYPQEEVMAKLESSLEVLKNDDKAAVLDALNEFCPEKLPPTGTEFFKSSTQKKVRMSLYDATVLFIKTILSKVETISHTQSFQTWIKEKNNDDDFNTYHQKLLRELAYKNKRNCLIETQSNEEIMALQTAFPSSWFLINTARDLRLFGTHIKRNLNDDTGTHFSGYGGPLYDYLQQHPEGGLLVNFSNFSDEESIRFNSILDKEPRLDGITLPPTLKIIGLINTQQSSWYQGSEYARFDMVSQSPAVRTSILHTNPLPNSTVIDLFHASDWEQRLLGRWTLYGHELRFESGELKQAIEKKLPIEVRNGPQNNPHFQQFWRQIRYSGVYSAGERIILQQAMYISSQEGYVWENLKKCIACSDNQLNIASGNLTVHSTNYSALISRYQYDDTQNHLIKMPGWLEESTQIVTHLNIVESLDDDAWAQILTKAHHLKILLRVHFSPEITPPAWFPDTELSVYLPKKIWNSSEAFSKDGVIVSTDQDTTIALLQKENQYIVIDVSECTPADLWGKLYGQFNTNTSLFEFNQTEAVLLRLLRNNQHIILTGQFSQSLRNELTSFLITRQHSDNLGQLICITSNEKSFSTAANVHTHALHVEEKSQFLNHHDVIKPYIEKESLSQLKARIEVLTRCPNATSTDEAWIGVYSFDNDLFQSMPPFDPKTSAQEAFQFTQDRLQAVNQVLEKQPFVLITGPSGVGKSTFVLETLADNTTLYVGEQQIHEWAKDSNSQRKILFLDEANLSSASWSRLEGLFQQPPHILIDGTLVQLDDHHKIVFAANPASYGDERHTPQFFIRHGRAVLFRPLPLSCIYEETLKPIFLKDMDETDIHIITKHILDIYTFFCQKSKHDILISPRELQTMALFACLKKRQSPHLDSATIIQEIAYQIAHTLLPKSTLFDFEQQFQPITQIQHQGPSPSITLVNNFAITPSRQPVLNQIKSLLDLREWRQQDTFLNMQQKCSGLGGIIIEGEPGIGKSDMVVQALIANGYQEEQHFDTPTQLKNPFYRIPVSMSLAEREQLLRKAFDEGAVVILDEINSSPMMERLLNSLLMGKTPENTSPKKPGFTLIGTQNPITMAGRRAFSNALKRRLLTCVLPAYTQDEMLTILCHKNIELEEARNMINVYEKNRQYALSNRCKPVPNCRDLLRQADNYLAKKNTYHREKCLAYLEQCKQSKPLTKSQRVKRKRSENDQFLMPIENIETQNEMLHMNSGTLTTFSKKQKQASNAAADIQEIANVSTNGLSV